MAKPGGGTGGGGGGTSVQGTSGPDTWNIATLDALIKFAKTAYDGRGGSDTFNFNSLAVGHGISIHLTSGNTGSLVSVTEGFTGLPLRTGSWTYFLDGVVANTIKNVENIVGSSFNDNLSAYMPGAINYLNGGAGSDSLHSSNYGAIPGDDILVGGLGADWIETDGIAVGGVWDGSFNRPGSSDRQSDTFDGTDMTILDFEVGTDRLMLPLSSSGIAGMPPELPWFGGTWTDPNGGDHPAAMLNASWTNGAANITLVGVSVLEAKSIQLSFRTAPSPGSDTFGGPGDDLLGATFNADTFVFTVGGGNDTIVYYANEPTLFNLAVDKLDFPDDLKPTAGDWYQTDVNGQVAIRYDYGDDSVTLLGLTTAIANQLTIV